MTKLILTCSPHFIDLALNEIRRSHPDTAVLQHIAPGYILLNSRSSFEQFTLPWQRRLPIYLHHAFPVHRSLSLPALPDQLAPLKQAVQKLAEDDAAIQVRTTAEVDAYGLTAEIQRSLNGKHAAVHAQPPTGRILSILIAPEKSGFRAYLGVSWASQNLSPWAGGQIPITEPVANRAGYKLLEALNVFSILLRKGNHALDLGAAPGAWTTLLRGRGLRVTAVAPAPLYPWLALDPQVEHQPMCAEDFLNHCRTTYDLIVNDMMLRPQESAHLMVEYARHLRREGIAIMTLKLRDHNTQRVMDHSFRILRKVYKIIRVRQLVNNRMEITLFLRRKSS